MAGKTNKCRAQGRWRRKPANLRYASEKRHLFNKLRRMRKAGVTLEDAKTWCENVGFYNRTFFDSLKFQPRNEERKRLRQARRLDELELILSGNTKRDKEIRLLEEALVEAEALQPTSPEDKIDLKEHRRSLRSSIEALQVNHPIEKLRRKSWALQKV